MNIDLSPLVKAVDPLWRQVKLLFVEHHFLTILCGFFAVMMTLSFYRFLRSINPALVLFFLMLILAMLVLHWTHTRTEPALLRPIIDVIAPFFPAAPAAAPPLAP